MRPWLLSLGLTAEEMKGAGWTEEHGIDKHFLDRARKSGMTIGQMESAESQIELFTTLSKDLQEKVLAKTLAELPKVKEALDKMWAAWQAGDPKAMDEELLKPYRTSEFRPLMEKMFDARNVKMAEQIEGFLKEPDTHFVVVGAGHLVGDKGLLKLLEEKKYKVEQVSRAKAGK